LSSRIQVRLLRRFIEKMKINAMELLPDYIRQLRCNVDYLNY
jgi:hypothetical protein